MTPEELKAKLECSEKITIIDVRQPNEYAICHLKEAKLIPLPELPNRLGELNPNDLILLYCHHGMRSMQATMWLQKKGF